mgnify:CR=1 FL=1
MNKINLKRVEKETLKTFRTEIPCFDFNHKIKKLFKSFEKNNENTFRNKYKFPPEMFKNSKLIDFGAGTGHKTIFFAKWGANCTLVELSDRSLNHAKILFKDSLKNFKKHKFINSSIFDYKGKNKNFDIVHCRGVLSHTGNKRKAFKKICSYIKKGGYLIFGDTNKAGGFQNMLQRYILYKFSKNDEEIVKNSEYLFKDDIDRSVKAVPRTRREAIYDRWVIQKQDDPSLSEVLSWFKEEKLELYSSYPSNPNFLISDSYFNKSQIKFKSFKNLYLLSELLWMTKTKDDFEDCANINYDLNNFSKSFDKLTSYVADCNKKTVFKNKIYNNLSKKFINDLAKVGFLKKMNFKIENFIKESIKIVEITNKGSLKDIKKFINNSKFIFKGPYGVRHVDFVAYKK